MTGGLALRRKNSIPVSKIHFYGKICGDFS
jgi:hypothetical protein